MKGKTSRLVDLCTTVLPIVVLVILFSMRQQLSLFVFITILFIVLDLYGLIGILSLSDEKSTKISVAFIYILVSAIGYFGLYKTFELWRTDPLTRPYYINFISGFAFALLVAKLVFSGGLFLQDFTRLAIGAVHSLASLMNLGETNDEFIPSRRKVVTWTATAIAAVPLVSMIYGITRGKYKYVVDKVTLSFKDLPEAFNGFKIIQISDAHAGSWDDIEAVSKGIDMIQRAGGDMIVFTGDLVNESKDEINPFLSLFATLSAPFGKFAVLGNHDYYGTPRNKEARQAYWEDFYSKYEEMGFDLILNQNRSVKLGNSEIKLVGVENWGAGRWFPKYGNLDRALDGCRDDDFCVLLSHDPTHWDEKVLPNSKKIQLTLSGHTHGMQFGLNYKWLKWSPIKYRYKRWIGLHEQDNQKLYINRGFGFLGFPGRVGMWPEITLIELQRDA